MVGVYIPVISGFPHYPIVEACYAISHQAVKLALSKSFIPREAIPPDGCRHRQICKIWLYKDKYDCFFGTLCILCVYMIYDIFSCMDIIMYSVFTSIYAIPGVYGHTHVGH